MVINGSRKFFLTVAYNDFRIVIDFAGGEEANCVREQQRRARLRLKWQLKNLPSRTVLRYSLDFLIALRV